MTYSMRLLFIFLIFISSGCENKNAEFKYSEVFFISKQDINIIRSKPSKIIYYYDDFKEKLNKSLPFKTLLSLQDIELFAVYSSFIAYSMATYGNSIKFEYKDLLREKKLDCDNYAMLTYYLFLEGKNKYGRGNDLKFKFVGWDGGAVGNHAQIFVSTKKTSILLDPSIGIVAITNFNTIASGIPVIDKNIFDFHT